MVLMVVSPTFRTEVPIEPRTHRPLLRHNESLRLLGSCFSTASASGCAQQP